MVLGVLGEISSWFILMKFFSFSLNQWNSWPDMIWTKVFSSACRSFIQHFRTFIWRRKNQFIKNIPKIISMEFRVWFCRHFRFLLILSRFLYEILRYFIFLFNYLNFLKLKISSFFFFLSFFSRKFFLVHVFVKNFDTCLWIKDLPLSV